MGAIYSVAGFVQLGADDLDALRTLIAENADGILFPESWLIHPHGGWSSYAFYGNTMKYPEVEHFRNQLLRINETIVTVDDDLGMIDHVEGRFLVRFETIERPCCEWILGKGELTERPCGGEECRCTDRPRYE